MSGFSEGEAVTYRGKPAIVTAENDAGMYSLAVESEHTGRKERMVMGVNPAEIEAETDETNDENEGE